MLRTDVSPLGHDVRAGVLVMNPLRTWLRINTKTSSPPEYGYHLSPWGSNSPPAR